MEVTLNHKLLLDEPCQDSFSLVIAMAGADGWHELEVAVIEPVYATVRFLTCTFSPFAVSADGAASSGALLCCFKFRIGH
jgi:hypothetical protein